MAKAKTDPLGNNWISCDICKDWLLFENSKLTTHFKDIGKAKLAFTCRACRSEQRITKLEEQLKSIADETSNTKTKMDSGSKLWADIVRDTNEVKEEVKKTVTAVTALENNAGPRPDLTAPQLRQVIDETEEVRRRERNLIVFGLPETDNDIGCLIEYARTCHVMLPEAEIETADRIGRVGSSPRLLKIKLATIQLRRNLLSMRPPEDIDPANRIFIRPDLTKAQMELDKQLRAELITAGKDKFMIRKGKIIPRPIPEKLILDDGDPTEGTSRELMAREIESETVGNHKSDLQPTIMGGHLRENEGWTTASRGRGRGGARATGAGRGGDVGVGGGGG